MKNANMRWTVAVGSALALAASTLGAGAAVAAVSDNSGPSFGDIDTSREGSITIYKHETQNPVTKIGDPTSTTDSLGTDPKVVSGVVFKAFKITNLELTGDNAAEGWKTLAGLQPSAYADACANVTTSNGKPVVGGLEFDQGKALAKTDGAGMAKLSNLTVASAYLFCETEAPATVTKKAAPFIVTVPYPDNKREGNTKKWVYDIAVYPKNSVGSIEKSINPQDPRYGLGSIVEFPVTVKIPTLAEGSTYKYFSVSDEFDPKLTVDRDSIVKSVVIGDTTLNPSEYTILGSDQMVEVKIIGTGLEKLNKSFGKNLVVTFQPTVNAVGAIKNDANLWTNPDSDTKPENPTPSTEVTTNWGNVKILKRDAGDEKTALEGAEFQVYAAETPYPGDGNCANAGKTGDPILVNGASTFTTGDDGIATIAGLYVSDSVNGTVNSQFRCYVLVETKAPAGYVLPKNPETPVKVTIGATADQVFDATILNTKSEVPELPLTGAAGTVVLSILGVVLIGTGTGIYVMRRRSAAHNS